MPEPQSGIIPEPNESVLFLLLSVPDRGKDGSAVARRMMGTAGDGHHDHLMGYTSAVSGAHFFAPSLDVLRSLT